MNSKYGMPEIEGKGRPHTLFLVWYGTPYLKPLNVTPTCVIPLDTQMCYVFDPGVFFPKTSQGNNIDAQKLIILK